MLGATIDQAPPGLTVDEATYRDTMDVLTRVGQTEPAAVAPFADAFDFSLQATP